VSFPIQEKDETSRRKHGAGDEVHEDDRLGYGGRPPVLKVVDAIADADTKARTVLRRNINHCTLCRLHHLGHLRDRAGDDHKQSDLRHAAGEKLQDDHSLAGLSSIPGTLRDTPRGGGYGSFDISQVKIDAAGRKDAALRAVGKAARFLLENVVIDDLTLAQTAQLMQVKDNAVLPALRVALDALAAHYGMVYTAPPPATPRSRSTGSGNSADPQHFRIDTGAP
jgi:hypothetical protein